MKKEDLVKYQVQLTMRSSLTEKKYMDFLQKKTEGRLPTKCIFCEKELLIKNFKYWVLLENRFPYDRLFQTSHMLAPKRHAASEVDLTLKEITELRRIKKKHLTNYHVILENVGVRISIKNHFHLHLLTFKK